MCDAPTSMEPAEFLEHLRGYARQIRDKVAEKAAETVKARADMMQNWVHMEKNRRTQEAGHEVSIPPDHGYSWMDESGKKTVDDWKNNYEINLLTFDAADKEESERKLREEHLTWIVDQFDRAGNLPKPIKEGEEGSPIAALGQIAGEGELVKIDEGSSNKDINASDNVSPGEGVLNTGLTEHVSGIQDKITGWKAGTADVFRDNFLPKIPTAMHNQVVAIKTLRNVLAANQGILKTARENIDKVAHEGLTAVEHFDDCCGGGDDTTAYIGIAAGVLTIAAGVATLPLTAGASGGAVAGGFTIVAGGATALQSARGVEGKDVALGADDLDGVVENIRNAVDDVWEDLDKANNELKDNAMVAATGKLNENAALFKAPMPKDFANADKGNVIDRTENG